MTLRLLSRLATATLLLVAITGCGDPVDEEWAGEETECKTGDVTDTDATKVVLFLEGPVTAMPHGWYGTENGEDTYSLTAIKEALYVGPMLNFTTESKVNFGASTFKVTGTFQLVKGPVEITGTVEYKSDNNTTTCKITLKGRR